MSRKENKLKGAAAATHQTYRRQSLTHFEDPTVEREVNYILEEQESLAIKFEHEESKSGKWILFVEHASMFSMWKKSCNLYSQGKLEGVTSLKASTAKDNSRTIVDAYGVIMFHCGPCDDKNLMMHYGKNIVELLSYFNKRGYIPYKSDQQSVEGTCVTGRKRNSVYHLPVARTINEYMQPRARERHFLSTGSRNSTPYSENEGSRRSRSDREFPKTTGNERGYWK